MLIVAAGLGLMIASMVPQIVGHILWWRRDYDVVLTLAAPVGPKLWIMIRMLQMGIAPAARVAALAGLMLHVLGVGALNWPLRNQTRAMRRMGMILRILLIIGRIDWIVLALRLPVGASRANNIRSPIVAWVTVLDVACIVLTGLVIAGVTKRGGYKRVAKVIVLLMVVQAAGLLLLFSAIYVVNQARPTLLWPSLLLHAAGGLGLTIISIWLIYKLAGAVRAVRAGVHIK